MNEKKKRFKVDREKFLKTHCGRCGNCCKEPIVPVNDSDVIRLRDATGIKIGSLVKMFAGTEVELEPDHDGVIRFKHGLRVMGLRRKDGRCVFQDSDNNCSVYEHRPVTCRTFPLAVFLGKNQRLRDLSFIGGIKCRRKTGPKRSLQDVKKLAHWEDTEDAKYYRKVKKWNKKGMKGGKSEFLEFVFGKQQNNGRGYG